MNSTDYFEGRSGNHDVACSIFINNLTSFSIPHIPIGTEYNKFGASEFLKLYNTDLAKFIRHFPDMYVVFSEDKHILVDVKSQAGNYSNYSIEADSLYAGIELNRINKPVYFACVDLQNQNVQIIDVADIKFQSVIVPKIRESEFRDDMISKFGKDKVQVKLTRSGSGTPYILIPKNQSGFFSVSEFVNKKDNLTNVWKINYGSIQQNLFSGIEA